MILDIEKLSVIGDSLLIINFMKKINKCKN